MWLSSSRYSLWRLRGRRISERDRVVDVDAILAAVTSRTRIVFIANPANPTGTIVPDAELRRMLAALPGDVLFVHDGAYAECAEGFDGGAALVRDFPNVIMTRTFSKLYGLGGLRIGWGHARRDIIEVLTRVRQPFNLSQAQMAAAEAAVLDRDFVTHCAAENARLRSFLRDALVQMGVGCDESHTNFVLARFADQPEAEACDAALRDAGIIVRRVAGYHIPEGLRITIGTESQVRRVIEVIARFKGVRA